MIKLLERIIKRSSQTKEYHQDGLPNLPKVGEIWGYDKNGNGEARGEIREVTKYSVTIFDPTCGLRTRSMTGFLKNYSFVKPASLRPDDIIKWLETNAKSVEWTDNQVILEYWLQAPGATWTGIDSRRVESTTLPGCVELALKSIFPGS